MDLGYIGLGIMGKECARHLLDAGHTLYIWARRPEACADLASLGAIVCDSAAEVASRVDIIFTNVSDTPDVEEVLLGENGVCKGARPGLIAVDMSTISPLATRRMAEELKRYGVELVDAPVSGGSVGAREGTLTFMVGAAEETYERILPVLKLMGKTFTRIGNVGDGQTAKACNQIAVAGNTAIMVELMRFAEACDVDPAKVREALLGGFAQSRVLELHGKRILDDDFTPGFKATLHNKDMNIVLDVAREKNLNLELTKIASRRISELVEQGDGDLDSSAVYRLKL